MTSTQTIMSSPTTSRAPASEPISVQKQDMENGSLYQMPIQCKLSIGTADDPLEKEADDMADKVMRMEKPSPINFSSSKNSVNRKCEHCEEEEKRLQKKENGNGFISAAPPIVHDVINSSAGTSLNDDTRSVMESRFNYDFSKVKIHDGDLAAKSASSINAYAYTSGNNIVFNSGQYNTNSDSGKRLLAHELTHVVQQSEESSFNGSGVIRRSVSPNYSTIRDKLTRGLFDWAVTDADAHEALRLLKLLNAADLRDTVAAMERDDLVDTLFGNITDEDATNESELLQRIQDNRTHSATSQNGNTTTTVSSTYSCTISQGNIMFQAMTTAQQWIDSAIARLGEFIAAPAAPGMANIRDALQAHVHTLNPAHITILISRLQNFRTQMFSANNLEVGCAAPSDGLCRAMAAAYVRHSVPKQMKFCSSFFTADATWRIEAMIHEAMHAFFANSAGGTVTDRAYAHERVYEFLSPEEAFDNSDSLAMLVQVLAQGRPARTNRPQDDISDCTSDQLRSLRPAIARAARWNLNSINVLGDSRADFRQGYAAERRQHFGTDNVDKIPSFLETYQESKNKLESSLDVECETAGGACSSNTSGYYRSFIFKSGTLHVCPLFFTLSPEERIKNFLALTIMNSTGKSASDASKYGDFAKAVTDKYWGAAPAI